MTEDELRAVEAKADAADIPMLTAEVRKLIKTVQALALEPKTPKFKVWFSKKLSASRIVEASDIGAAQQMGEKLAADIKDDEATVSRDWSVGIAVPADE